MSIDELIEKAFSDGYEYALMEQREFGWFGDKMKGLGNAIMGRAAKMDSKGRANVDAARSQQYGLGQGAKAFKGNAQVSAADAMSNLAVGAEKLGNRANALQDRAAAAINRGKERATAAINSGRQAITGKVESAKSGAKSLWGKARAGVTSAANNVRNSAIQAGRDAKAAGLKAKRSALMGVANAAGRLQGAALRGRKFSDVEGFDGYYYYED